MSSRISKAKRRALVRLVEASRPRWRPAPWLLNVDYSTLELRALAEAWRKGWPEYERFTRANSQFAGELTHA